ncbi:MAG: zf-HC2 domain-containing protein [Firmicutes bacterium]|nr:zf-HC2 domain-containing protein [Bacillota bacterium]
MKFMDGPLSAREAAELERHAGTCATCAEDFAAYRGIMADFSETELICAPEGFEEAVMGKIRALPAIARSPEFFDGVVYGIWGVFSVLIGLGLILVLNRDAILADMSQNAAYANFMALISPVYAYVSDLAGNIAAGWRAFANGVYAYAEPIKYAVVAIFVILAAVQFFARKREPVKTR